MIAGLTKLLQYQFINLKLLMHLLPMILHFNFFNICILLGTLQGVIISCILLFSFKDKRQSKYFLAAFMLVLAYNSLGTFCWSAGVNISWLDFFDGVFPYTFIFTVGSSLYLYIKTLVQADKIPRSTIFKAYLPSIIDFVFRVCLLLYAILNSKGISLGVNAHRINGIYYPVAQTLIVIIFWCYLAVAIARFRKWEKQRLTKGHSSSAEQNLVSKWLKAFLIAMSGVALVWAATVFGRLIFNVQGITFYYPIEITLVIFVYWIGFAGYHRTSIVYINAQKTAKAYSDGLATEEVENCISLLKKVMENDKLYLDPVLTVNKLAEKLDLSPRTISAVLNGELKKGFSEFVNEYRIAEVKSKMLQAKNNHITIAGLAFESGFNSVATFQRAFKSMEHITPKEFLSFVKNQDK